jgi:hypothetical protein
MPESSGDDVVAGFAIYQPDQNPGMGLNTEKDEKTLINEHGQNICFVYLCIYVCYYYFVQCSCGADVWC